jgi:hypothetical protein
LLIINRELKFGVAFGETKVYNFIMKKYVAFLLLVVVCVGLLLACSGGEDVYAEATSIVSPYDNICFATALRLRAELHTHTLVSDGSETDEVMLLAYANLGYDIVAITDHNVGYAGETEYREIGGRNMLVVRGNEVTLSRRRHFNNIFTDTQTGSGSNFGRRIQGEIDRTEGLMFLNHPTWSRANVRTFANLLDRFDADRLVGIEIANWDTDQDLVFWDGLLTRLAPSRTVFGYMNDDAHSLEHVGWVWNEFFVTENTIPNVKSSVQNGKSLMYCITDANKGGVMPSINNITVCNVTMTISIEADNYTSIEWVSRGEVVSNSNTINVNDLKLMRYVRFAVTGTGGRVFSQPFMLFT